jgi:hypothetical protein
MTTQLELEVTVNKHKYRISRMSVFEQMNVAADYRDILVALAMLKRDRPKKMRDAEFQHTVKMIMVSRAGNTPDIRDRVTNLCLGKIVRQSNLGMVPVLATEGVMQFDDIELPQIVQMLYATFEFNKLLDFFSESPSTSDGQDQEIGQDYAMEKTG